MSLRIVTGRGLLRRAGGALLYQIPGANDEDYDPETQAWIAAADEADGTYLSDSKSLADGLIRAIKAASYNSKIKYLLPFLGGNLATALVPLRDSLAVGTPSSIAFTDGDFRQSRGLTGNGTTKYLNSNIAYNALGPPGNAGIGFWITRIDSPAELEPMGCNNVTQTSRYCLDLRLTGSIRQSFQWGTPGNEAIVASIPSTGHYYGQRAADVRREIYLNGTRLAFNTTADTAAGAPSSSICIFSGGNVGGGTGPWPGRGGVAYMTDGSLTAGEAAAFHQVLRTKLMVPTGRAA